MRLRTKIILLIVAVTLGAGLGSSLLVSQMMHDTRESELRDQAVLAVQSLAEHVARHVIDGEVIEAHEAIEKMVERSESIQYAYIIDFDGRLFAHTFEGGFPEALVTVARQYDPVSAQSPRIVYLVTGNGRILDVGYPLINGMAACVHVGMDEEHTYARVASLRKGIIHLSLLLAGAGIAIGALASRRMTRPLSDLAGVMRDFGTRKMEEKVEFSGGGREIAHLTRAFNQTISDRKRAAEALQESHAKLNRLNSMLRLMCDNLPESIWTKDLQGRFMFVNKSCCENLLNARDVYEPVGKTDIFFAEREKQTHPENPNYHTFGETCTDSDKVVLEIKKVIKKDESGNIKGRFVILDVIKSPFWDENGELIGTVGCARDVTRERGLENEREQLLAQNQTQARLMRGIMDTVPEGVLLLDANGYIALANPAAGRALAVLVAREDLSTRKPLTRLGDRSLAELLTSPPTKGLWHEVKADGRTFEVIARPMANDPEPENWVLVIRDVTQEREIEWRTQQQERLAAVGQLAAGVAHDFNNIMTVILLYTQMSLNAPDLPAKIRQRLETVSGQAYKATDLVQQILDFSRRAVLERRPMALTPFLKEQVKMLERTLPENIEIGLTYGTDDYTVHADPTRAQQIVLNLALNARDAMLPLGGGKLHIVLSRTAATDTIRCVVCNRTTEGEWVRIAVTDNGAGIPPGVLAHIFEPFFTTKEVGQGTGLGLAQVAGIVAQHEGHVDVTTKTGGGTTFTIYLPALLGQQSEAPVLETQVVARGQGEVLLLVEDNAALREALADSLELLNYRVLQAANGRKALAIMEQHADEIALVLTDVVMPEMGGQALFQALRRRDLTLPVVMLTGHPMESELEGLQAQGLAGWMLKPPDMEQLSQLLARALSKDAE